MTRQKDDTRTMTPRRVLAIGVGLLLIAVGGGLYAWIEYPGACSTPSGYCLDPPLARVIVGALSLALGSSAGVRLILNTLRNRRS